MAADRSTRLLDPKSTRSKLAYAQEQPLARGDNTHSCFAGILRPIRDSNPCRRRERAEITPSFAGILFPTDRRGQILVKDEARTQSGVRAVAQPNAATSELSPAWRQYAPGRRPPLNHPRVDPTFPGGYTCHASISRMLVVRKPRDWHKTKGGDDHAWSRRREPVILSTVNGADDGIYSAGGPTDPGPSSRAHWREALAGVATPQSCQARSESQVSRSGPARSSDDGSAPFARTAS